MKPYQTIALGLLLLAGLRCKQRYDAPIHNPARGYLVVEGYIACDTGATVIHLSRTVALDTPLINAEPGAQVQVEAKSGATYSLQEGASGVYAGHVPAVDFSDQYRLDITTTDNRKYQSAFSPPISTPPIDSVTWKPDSTGVRLYVSTHDPTGQAVNFRWDYDETWRYTSAFESQLVYTPHSGRYSTLELRDSAHQFHTCYLSGGATDVYVTTTTNLTQDILSQFPLALISYSASNRLVDEYSVNVKQHAISTAALNYFRLVKKNTETVGSIFDAQPSEITGNLTCVSDPGQIVIGFVECSSKTEKRIFISNRDIPDVAVHTRYEDCGLLTDTLTGPHDIDSLFVSNSYTPINSTAQDVVTLSNTICVDCRVLGGTLTKPAFWP